MTSTAIESLEADREALLSICADLDDAQWEAPSGCEGWRTQDVVAHMGALFWLIVDRAALPDAGDRLTEDSQELYVESRRGWSAAQVLDDYAQVSLKAVDQLAALGAMDFELPLADLGTYNAGLLPNAYTFDHFTHIRADLLEPRGSLTAAPPPADGLRMVPVLDWVEAALPQQNAALVAALPGAVDLVVDGPGGRTVVAGTGDRVATVTSPDGVAFVRWATQRGSWDELGVKAEGDPAALGLIRRVKLF